jgi:hypothetical protein
MHQLFFYYPMGQAGYQYFWGDILIPLTPPVIMSGLEYFSNAFNHVPRIRSIMRM